MPKTTTDPLSCSEREPHHWDIPGPPDHRLTCVRCGYEFGLLGITPEARADRIEDMRFTPAHAFFEQALDATIEVLERSQRLGLS